MMGKLKRLIVPPSELQRLREENARLKEEMRMNDPASYSSMVYWREKCYEARAKLAKVVEALELGLALAKGELINFKHYGLKSDDDISGRIEAALDAAKEE